MLQPEVLDTGWTRDRIAEAISAEGVPCFSGSCPAVYREASFADSGLAPAEPLPVASSIGELSLMFLVHPTLGEEDMRDTVDAVAKVFATVGG